MRQCTSAAELHLPKVAGFYFERYPGVAELSSLVLLHGSGQREDSLLEFADAIAPERMVFALRGSTPWEDGFAFFRRNPDRSLDHEDLALSAVRLGEFLRFLNARSFRRPILVGYSNGAIIAAATIAKSVGLSRGAILLRPLSPFVGDIPSPLAEYPVLMLAAQADERRHQADAPLLADQLRKAGASVHAHILPCGHGLDEQDVILSRVWLSDMSAR
jgi:phospholipase/carboxylesterase